MNLGHGGRNTLASLVVFATVLVAMSTSTVAIAAASGTVQFVGRQGTSLVAGGQPWKFAGYNLPCDQPFLLSPDELGYYFDDIKVNSKANVVRMWWFQSEMGTGSDPWAPFEQIVAVAKAHGIQIIATLTNEWNTCDEPNPPNTQKTLAWYQGGYKTPEGGYALSFKDYATQMSAHFAGEPTIAFWQLVNEAEAPAADASGNLTCDNSKGMLALRSFSDQMANALHRVDHHHLVNLGTSGTGQCGTSGSPAYRYVYGGALDLCEVHDYGAPAVALSTGPNSISRRINDCHALGKAIFVGESGIPSNVQPDGSSGTATVTSATLTQRASFFKAKIDAANSAGMVGYVIWYKSPFYTPFTEQYSIGEGDPTEVVLADALLQTSGGSATMSSRWCGKARHRSK